MRQSLASIIKERQPVSVRPWAPATAALELLAHHSLGALPVLDEERLVGVFSERDYVRKLGNRKPEHVVVGELMTPNPYTASVGQSIEDCLQLMIDGAFRHLPVMEDGVFIGMVSILDIGHAVLQHQASLILDLESYEEAPTA